MDCFGEAIKVGGFGVLVGLVEDRVLAVDLGVVGGGGVGVDLDGDDEVVVRGVGVVVGLG